MTAPASDARADDAQGTAASGPGPSDVTRLIFVRHGLSLATEQGVVGGHNGCSGLAATGRRQAEALRDRLTKTGFEVDLVLTSLLPRAIETAEIVADGLGVDVATIRRRCDLCERHPGEGDGLTWDVFVQRYGAVDPLTHPDEPPSPGGESAAAFRARVTQAVAGVVADHPGQRVMLVCHGGVILYATMALLGIPNRRLAPDLAHTSLTEWVRDTDGRWLLARFNDAAHLEPNTAP
jgi:broad specificity phosphatase PhoE